MPTLVHELVAIDRYKQKVLTPLLPAISEASSSKAYFVVYHETVLCNFLSLLLYHKHVCQAAGDTYALFGLFVRSCWRVWYARVQPDRP